MATLITRKAKTKDRPIFLHPRKSRVPTDTPARELPAVRAGTYHKIGNLLWEANDFQEHRHLAAARKAREEALRLMVNDMSTTFPNYKDSLSKSSYAHRVVQNAWGDYDPDTRHIRISADGARTPGRMASVLMHEVVHDHQRQIWNTRGLPHSQPLVEFDANLGELEARKAFGLSSWDKLGSLDMTYRFLAATYHAGDWDRIAPRFQTDYLNRLEKVRVEVCREEANSAFMTTERMKKLCAPEPPRWRQWAPEWITVKPKPTRPWRPWE